MTLTLSNFYLEHKLNKELPGLDNQKVWLDEIAKAMGDSFPGNSYPGSSFPGYRFGVILIPVVNLFSFKHKTITLKAGEILDTIFEPRVTGEEPRKHTTLKYHSKDLPIAPYVFAVLYSRSVLAEDGEYIEEEWAVVDHTTSSIPKPEPINVGTLLANHFHLSGGTATQLTPIEFESLLRESFLYWRDKCLASIHEE